MIQSGNAQPAQTRTASLPQIAPTQRHIPGLSAMTDIRALREAAKKATPGPWATHRESVLAGGGTDTYSGRVLGAICYCEPTTQTDSEGRTWSTSGSAENNATFIALANPAAIIALLDRLKEAEQHIARLVVNPDAFDRASAQAHLERHNNE